MLRSNAKISLQCENEFDLHYLAGQSLQDQNFDDLVYQKVKISSVSVSQLNLGEFHHRCIFRVLKYGAKDTCDVICFGDMIHLMHESTGFYLCDNYLCSTGGTADAQEEELESLWVVESRYKVKSVGDAVESSDYIVLVRYVSKKILYLGLEVDNITFTINILNSYIYGVTSQLSNYDYITITCIENDRSWSLESDDDSYKFILVNRSENRNEITTLGWQITLVESNTNQFGSRLIHDNCLVRLQHCITRRYLVLISDVSGMKYTYSTTHDATDRLTIFIVNKCEINKVTENKKEVITFNDFITITHNESQRIPIPAVKSTTSCVDHVKITNEFRLAGALCISLFEPQMYRDIDFLQRFKLYLLSIKLLLAKTDNLDCNTLQSIIHVCSNFLTWVMIDGRCKSKTFDLENVASISKICVEKQNIIAHLGIPMELITLTFCIFDVSSECVLSAGYQNVCDEYIYPCLSISIMNNVKIAHLFMRTEGLISRLFQMILLGWKVPIRLLLFTISTNVKTMMLASDKLKVPLSCLWQLSGVNGSTIDLLTIICQYNTYVDYGDTVKSFRTVVIESLNVAIHTKYEVHSNLFSLRYCNGQWEILSDNIIEVNKWILWRDIEYHRLQKWLNFLLSVCEGEDITTRSSINKLLPASFLVYMLHHSENDRKILIHELISCIYVHCDLVYKKDDELYHYFFAENQIKEVCHQQLFNDNENGDVTGNIFDCHIITELINISLASENDAYNYTLCRTIKDLISIGFFHDKKEMLLKLLLTNLTAYLKSANNDTENFINSRKLCYTLLTLCEFTIDQIYSEILQIDISLICVANDYSNTKKLKLLQAVNDSNITELFLLISCHPKSLPITINLVNRVLNKQIYGYTFKLQQLRSNSTAIVETDYDKETIVRINNYYEVIKKYCDIYGNDPGFNKEAVHPAVKKLIMQCSSDISTTCHHYRMYLLHKSPNIFLSHATNNTSYRSVLNPLHAIHNGILILYNKIMRQVGYKAYNDKSAKYDIDADEFDTSYFIEQQCYNFDPLLIGEISIMGHDGMTQSHYSTLICDILHQIISLTSVGANSTAWILASESTRIFVDIYLLIIVDILSISSSNSYQIVEKYLKAENGEDPTFSIMEWYYTAGMGKLSEYILTYSALDALFLFPHTDTTLTFFQSILIRYGTDQATSITTCKLLLAILLNSSYDERKHGMAATALDYMINQGCTFANYKYSKINEQYFYTLRVISQSLIILNSTMPDQFEKNKVSSCLCFKLKDGITLLCSDAGLILKCLVTEILLSLYDTDAQLKIQLSYCFYSELICIHKAVIEKRTEQFYVSVAEYVNLAVKVYIHFFSSIEYDDEQYGCSFILKMIEKSPLNNDIKNQMKRIHILSRCDLKQKQNYNTYVDNIIPLSALEGINLLLDIICDRINIAKATISDLILNRIINEINLLSLIGKAYAITRTVTDSDHFARKLTGKKLRQNAIKLIDIISQRKNKFTSNNELNIEKLLDKKNNTGLNTMMNNLTNDHASNLSTSNNQVNSTRHLTTLKVVMHYISRHENHDIIVDGTINEILELIQTFLNIDNEKLCEIRRFQLVSAGIIKSLTHALGRFHGAASVQEFRFLHNLIKIYTLLIQKSDDGQSLKYFSKGEFTQLKYPLNGMLLILLKAKSTTYIQYFESNEESLYMQILQLISKLAMNKKYFHLLLLPNDQNVNIIDTIVNICIDLLQNIGSNIKYVRNSDLYKMQIELSSIPELNNRILLNSSSSIFVRRFIAFYDITTDYNVMDKLVSALTHTYNVLTTILEGYNITFKHVFRDDAIKIAILDATLNLLEYFGAFRLEGKILQQDNSTLYLSATNPNEFVSLYYYFCKKQNNTNHIELIDAYHASKSRIKWDKIVRTCTECEAQIMRFLTSLTNGRIKATMTTLREQYLENEKSFVILFQNMDTLFKNQSTHRLGISYWAFFSQFNTQPYTRLHQWKTSTSRGNSFDCYTVYIVDNNKRISKCVYQVPEIAILWTDRDIKRLKKLLTYFEITRVGSIELKMMSFYDAMYKLLNLMRRKQHQQLFVNRYVTWCIAAVNLRVIFLTLTVILNTYYGLFLNYESLTNETNKGINIRYLFSKSLAHSYMPSIVPTNYPSAAPMLAYSVDNSIILQKIISYILTSKIVPFSIQILHLIVISLITIAEIRSSDEYEKLVESYSRLPCRKSLLLIRQLLLKYAWFIILLLCSMSASFVGNTFLYSVALLDIINQFSIMKYVVESIKRNIYRISATLMLSFILLWMFSTINIVFFPPNSYNFNGHEACHSNLADCIKLHIDYGFINSPNWNTNDFYNSTSMDDGNNEYGTGSIKTSIRGINTGYPLLTNLLDNTIASGFNLLYVLLINLVLQSIISGLIIDTFSTMRAEEDAKLDDIQNKCFVCNLSKGVIEKTETFADHIKDHYQWNYLFFIEYLQKKDPKSFSAPEHFAYECFNSRQRFSQILPYNINISNQDPGQ